MFAGHLERKRWSFAVGTTHSFVSKTAANRASNLPTRRSLAGVTTGIDGRHGRRPPTAAATLRGCTKASKTLPRDRAICFRISASEYRWVTNVLMDRRSRLTRRPFRTKRLVTHPQDHALIRFRRQPKMGPRRCILRRFFAGFSIAILSRYGLALPRGATTLNGCVKAICTPFCDIVLV